MSRRISSPEAIKRISKDLNLAPPDSFTQDWEYEVADRLRLEEFIQAYNDHRYGGDEKFVLMRLMIQAFDDALQFEDERCDRLWNEIVPFLVSDANLHKATISYWCLWNEDDCGLDEESSFAVTKQMRQVDKIISANN
ncbi:hypothetical protein Pan153_24940 [Gimesia panareensis]|uniref:Uncharacterized protein n=1 Tax=Gimesia panareensis TaxID=2527978 RepID=A0A518FNB5_9PLAN|nr:hypothetical protein [Gimesia panareensis]QDV17838.1 hypothetical protein Pan153_24940 [Gimesia panareensis]